MSDAVCFPAAILKLSVVARAMTLLSLPSFSTCIPGGERETRKRYSPLKSYQKLSTEAGVECTKETDGIAWCDGDLRLVFCDGADGKWYSYNCQSFADDDVCGRRPGEDFVTCDDPSKFEGSDDEPDAEEQDDDANEEENEDPFP